MDISITRLSSRGQIVIPRDIREKTGLREGEKLFAYSGDKDTIILKKIAQSINQFEKLTEFGTKFAKQKKISEKDVLEND